MKKILEYSEFKIESDKQILHNGIILNFIPDLSYFNNYVQDPSKKIVDFFLNIFKKWNLKNKTVYISKTKYMLMMEFIINDKSQNEEEGEEMPKDLQEELVEQIKHLFMTNLELSNMVCEADNGEKFISYETYDATGLYVSIEF